MHAAPYVTVFRWPVEALVPTPVTATYCKYHSSIPARWNCASCGIDLCSQCIKTEYLPQAVAVCPVCKNELQAFSASNLITPFWYRIPRFFVYPFNLTALVYIAALALLSVVLFKPNLLAMLMQVVLFLVFLRYAYAVLNHTALGHMTPPPVNFSMVTDGLEMPFKQLGVYIFMGIAFGFLLSSLGAVAATIYLVVMLVCIPATAMVIAVENSFMRAINPLALVSIVTRIGWSYLILCIFLLILWGGTSVVMELIGGSERSIYVLLLVYNLVTMYFLLVMYHMMGYAIYQYHEELGFQVEVDAEEQPELKRRAGTADIAPVHHPVISEAEVLVKEGKIPEAIAVLRDGLAQNGQDLEIQERLHKLLKIGKQAKLLIETAPAYIRNLLAQNHARKAADVYADAFAFSPAFKLTAPDQVYPIASELKQAGRAKAALAAMDGFAKHFPGHQDVPKLYLLAAKILCETFKQDRKAKGILEQLLARYPQHPLGADIRNYLDTIKNLAS